MVMRSLGNVDVALIYDVLHHIQARDEFLKNLAGYIALFDEKWLVVYSR